MIVAGFLIGFLGSLHCLGMCGPIAMAMHTQAGYKSVVYNIGRVVSYAFIGLVLGSIGSGVSLFGMQRQLSVVAGVVVLLIAFFPQLHNHTFFTPWQKHVISPLRKVLNKAVAHKSVASYFMVGVLNGLLPCGLVYLAASTSIAAGSVLEASGIMIGFGLGTWPMMLGVGWGSHLIKDKLQNQFKYVIPTFAIIMGSMLILRGMAMDIPYLSPLLSFTGMGADIPVCN